uniref:Calcineurin regulatory subunit B n=1 Tax=Trepomonas sp. PC1 TaxID=1076344 RepID=A0A146K5G1_9EUKA|eukprot:JAP92140.1 Calcineurin regulatory subunit B [Trepomonas sp. PC1]
MGGQQSFSTTFEQDIANLPQHYFSKIELRRLWGRFYNLTNGDKFLTTHILRQIPELQLNPLADRIAELFVDQTDQQSISFSSFVSHLSIFSYKASEEEKLRFVFAVYDKDKDGQVNEAELYEILKACVGNNIEDAQLKLLVQGTMADADKNGEKQLNYDEFKQCISRNTGLAEKITVRF